MRKILVLLAHPKYEHSVVSQTLIRHIQDLENLTINDLYEAYPDFNIDVQREQELLFVQDVVVFQHPIYWYSAPPLLKQWQDLVLEYGWAYGPGGVYLRNKWLLNTVSSGGTAEAYSAKGRHGHTLREFLLPFEQTAKLCNMVYLPPFCVGGTHKIRPEELEAAAQQYRKLLLMLRDTPTLPEGFSALDEANHYFD